MNGVPRDGKESGQVLALFAITLTAILMTVGLVIDGGNGLTQRRNSQNTADFAALAGARIIAEWISGDTVNGTDGNVKQAIANAVTANCPTPPSGVNPCPITFGTGGVASYVDSNGQTTGTVGSGNIPGGTVGVRVSVNRAFNTYFLGIVGMNTLQAGATATARGGYATTMPQGSLFPAGVALAFFQTYPFCVGDVNSTDSCKPQHLTPGSLNVPGGFGWLKFGCTGYGLGQVAPANAGGCSNAKTFLQDEIGPPSHAYGCCTQVGQSGSADQIGSLPGNKVSADCSYWIDNGSTVIVPVWDYAGGTGSNGWYHIVGFAGFQITACDGGKDIEGVWRKPFFEGPVTSTATGLTFQPLGVQLIQ